jgi:hypothetical protein
MLGKGAFEYETLWPERSGFSVTGDMRQMHRIGIEDEAFLICLPNNGPLQLFKHGK